MTNEEKAAFLSGMTVWQTRGFKRLNIPSIYCADGPHGVRKQAARGDHLGLNPSLAATCFPTAAAMANSWDEELAEAVGMALGEEAVAQEVDVLLGPGLNIKRSPLCGRNFEYFSEDPYLSGKMAAALIRGIQSRGIYACPKHFAVNNQELRRMSMNAVLDERTLREIYLTGFEIAVTEGKAKAIMTSYNEVNGVYANENRHLLLDILRETWGFEGIVITDWGGSNDHVQGVRARSNLEMPSPGLSSARELLSGLAEGTLAMAELDRCVDDLLDAVLTLKAGRPDCKKEFDAQSHHQLARRAAQESIVLLKNNDQLLPLKKHAKIALIGDFAVEPRYQGSGSSMVNANRLETMEQLVSEYDLQCIGVARGYHRFGKVDEALRKQALELAAAADVVLYCFGLDELSEAEGQDRTHMRIPENQIGLLAALASVNSNLVGILSAGAAIEMPWQKYCKSILHGYLSGQAGAGAMFDILTGKINPSGKLSETCPLRYEDSPAFGYFPGRERNSEYREGIFVGYRYYDTGNITVQYPFGYGLSYTKFAYGDLEVYADHVEFALENVGDFDGAEIAQLYVGLPESAVFRPRKELKGFQKVFLKQHERKRVRIFFDDKTFRYWNTSSSQWETEGGTYSLMVGSSVLDIRLQGLAEIKGTNAVIPYMKEKLPSYYTGAVSDVKDAEFEQLLGYPLPDGTWGGELDINDAVCQLYYAKSRLARLIYKFLTARVKYCEKKGRPDLNLLFIYNLPFRGIAKMTGGMVSMEMVRGMVTIVNGHFMRGFKQLIAGFIANSVHNKKYKKIISKEE